MNRLTPEQPFRLLDVPTAEAAADAPASVHALSGTV